jgi:hypothetical protein
VIHVRFFEIELYPVQSVTSQQYSPARLPTSAPTEDPVRDGIVAAWTAVLAESRLLHDRRFALIDENDGNQFPRMPGLPGSVFVQIGCSTTDYYQQYRRTTITDGCTGILPGVWD